MKRATLKALAAVPLLVLAGCGFQLRGQSTLPFDGAYVEAGAGSVMASQLRNHLSVHGKLVDQRDKADVIVRLTNESRGKTILSLSGGGKVREYRLTHAMTLSAILPNGSPALDPADIKLTRDISYNDEQVLAKDAEEAMLRKDMDDDALRQILRRLAFVRKK